VGLVHDGRDLGFGAAALRYLQRLHGCGRHVAFILLPCTLFTYLLRLPALPPASLPSAFTCCLRKACPLYLAACLLPFGLPSHLPPSCLNACFCLYCYGRILFQDRRVGCLAAILAGSLL